MTQKTLVWDLPVRAFHWLLVIAIAGAWYTADQGMESIHMKIGYFIIGLLIFRILWGFAGTTHSRFCSFVPTPSNLSTHIKTLLKPATKHYVGHNPLGAISAFIMLILVALQATTGLFTKGEIWYGPYTSALGEEIVKRLDGIHHLNFDYILIAAVVHVFAILFYLFYKKQNLVTPMITGKKLDVDESEGITSSKLIVAGVLIAVVAVFVYWLVIIAPPPVVYEYDFY